MSIYKIKEMLDTMKAKKNTVHFFVKYEESFICFAFGFTSLLPSALLLITREVISTSKSIDDFGADVNVVGLVAVDVVGLAAVDVFGLEAVDVVGLEAVDVVGLAAVDVVCLVAVDVDVVVLVIFSDSRAVVTIDVVSGFLNFFGILNFFKYWDLFFDLTASVSCFAFKAYKAAFTISFRN